MEFDPKKVAEWLYEPTEEEVYEEWCKEQVRQAGLTKEERNEEMKISFEDQAENQFEDQAERNAYCKQNGHTFRDESWAGPESGGMAGTCRVCGYSFSTTLY